MYGSHFTLTINVVYLIQNAVYLIVYINIWMYDLILHLVIKSSHFLEKIALLCAYKQDRLSFSV